MSENLKAILVGSIIMGCIIGGGYYAIQRDIETTDYISNNIYVGTKLNSDKCKFVEETTEWKKYRISGYYITVKNDTVVAIWTRR